MKKILNLKYLLIKRLYVGICQRNISQLANWRTKNLEIVKNNCQKKKVQVSWLLLNDKFNNDKFDNDNNFEIDVLDNY